MAQNRFRVIIAGGSIAGLSLALMLQQNDIDFLVLEAYPEIAPQVGASIAILPNGMRILDQLGCYEDIMEKAQIPVHEVFFRRATGQPFWSFPKFSDASIQRHGYPLVFLDRRMVIAVLYSHIKDKSMVVTQKQVVSVDQIKGGVKVRTGDGSTYVGDILVGADGIYSTVRQCMWEIAERADPEWIPPTEKTAVPATYGCIFGISTGMTKMESGTLHSVFNNHFSYLVPVGPDGRCYWFLVFNLGKTFYGPEIPRFTKEDEEAIAKQHWHDRITEDIQFRDLYEHKISSVCTPLHEYVYRRWHFGRIMTIGDSCHKFEPLSGQGGNNAIETAASLTNFLVDALRGARPGHLSDQEVKDVFESVQRLRSPRVSRLVKESHRRQRLEAMETPLLRAVATYLVPWIGRSTVFNRWIQAYCSAVSLHTPPIPERPRQIPYDDELRSEQGNRRRILPIASFSCGLIAMLLYRYFFGGIVR